MLEITNLSVSVKSKTVIEDISCVFEKNKVFALMGPNGSGKSTFGNAIVGNPAYAIGKKSRLIFKKTDVTEYAPEKRSRMGIFMAFQSPPSLTGVTAFQLLRMALSKKKDPYRVKKEIDRTAKLLKISSDLLSRPLNEGASGGERKKIELLQAIVMDFDFLILDEIDTGVDIDSLKIIAKALKKIAKDKTILMITHYNRILKLVKPDKVMIMVKGSIVEEGDARLADKIEKNGYERYEKDRS